MPALSLFPLSFFSICFDLCFSVGGFPQMLDYSSNVGLHLCLSVGGFPQMSTF